MVHHQMLQ